MGRPPETASTFRATGLRLIGLVALAVACLMGSAPALATTSIEPRDDAIVQVCAAPHEVRRSVRARVRAAWRRRHGPLGPLGPLGRSARRRRAEPIADLRPLARGPSRRGPPLVAI